LFDKLKEEVEINYKIFFDYDFKKLKNKVLDFINNEDKYLVILYSNSIKGYSLKELEDLNNSLNNKNKNIEGNIIFFPTFEKERIKYFIDLIEFKKI
jgi:hypothetical protein